MTERADFGGWDVVQRHVRRMVDGSGLPTDYLNEGQRGALSHLAKVMRRHGAVLADEVGLGKTRIAVALACAVADRSGRVAVVVPPVVEPQWRREFKDGGTLVPPMLRSLDGFLSETSEGSARANDAIVLMSHNFGNIYARSTNTLGRAALLRAIHDLSTKQRLLRRKSDDWRNDPSGRLAHAVLDRAQNCKRTEKVRREIVDTLGAKPRDWARRLRKGGKYQPLLERAVGLALGPFDLVIIDEAHKSRGGHTKLSILLETILLTDTETRRLGMTATPVELDVSQWERILARVGAGDWESISKTVHDYRDAVRDVGRLWRSSEQARERYESASKAFEAALSPYMVRRDKRGDETVRLFQSHAGEHRTYRHEDPIEIELGGLTPQWRASVFAAEALSMLGTRVVGSASARARLTVSNGHGVAAVLDSATQSEVAAEEFGDEGGHAAEQRETDEADAREPGAIDLDGAVADAPASANEAHAGKLRGRAEWWQNVMLAPVRTEGHPLYGHPAVLAAAKAVEQHVENGDKVLVFGRYTRPMQALVRLLNARALLRALDGGGGVAAEQGVRRGRARIRGGCSCRGKGSRASRRQRDARGAVQEVRDPTGANTRHFTRHG